MFRALQHDYDKQYGFNDFPYTHGDDVERAQESATKKWREELVDELEKKGAIKAAKGIADTATERQISAAPGESELQEKARGLDEAKQNDHMLNLKTNSIVLKN